MTHNVLVADPWRMNYKALRHNPLLLLLLLDIYKMSGTFEYKGHFTVIINTIIVTEIRPSHPTFGMTSTFITALPLTSAAYQHQLTWG